ncbi:hypothetical protein O0L34_g10725 [Tuta absoluta]|nr:hypothetical protein O0L34_g10725 [Tuta absoluta]
MPTVVVKERGLLKFIESSNARGDGKENCFMNRCEITLHQTCRNSYNNPKCIEAEKKRKKKESGSEPVSNIEFDFQNNCFFCDKDASLIFDKQLQTYVRSTRISVGQVDKLTTQHAIIQACTTCDDEWSQQVLSRIQDVNIVERNARYHIHCYNKFCQTDGTAPSSDVCDKESTNDPTDPGFNRTAKLKHRRHQSESKSTATAMNHVFEFIEEKALESSSEAQDGIFQEDDLEIGEIKSEVPDPIQQEELLTKEDNPPSSIHGDEHRVISTDTVDPLQAATDTNERTVRTPRLSQKRHVTRDRTPSIDSIEEPHLEPRIPPNKQTEAQSLKRKMLIMEKEFRETQKRAKELHSLEMDLMRERLREARAKADLAELLLQQQKQKTSLQSSLAHGNHIG